MNESQPRRVAIVHDWLVTHSGAEQVLDRMLEVYPQADLFSLVCAMPGEPIKTYRGRKVTTSFIQRLPLGTKKFRAYLPLFPLAIEQFNLSAYDLIISSSFCVAKGVLTGPDQCHVCYCYSPVRYAWDLQHQYLRESGLAGIRGWPARLILHRLRQWDVRTANGVDNYITLSRYIARRIRKCYGRDAVVVAPPVSLENFPLSENPRKGFVTASRMVPYKRMPLIVEAFAAMPDLELTVIGDGPDFKACKAAAQNAPNIHILGYQPREVLRDKLSNSQAFVFAAEEDFGIAPLEAQACGTPVIAFRRGGATETIQDGISGFFFNEQSVSEIKNAVRNFLSAPPLDPIQCRKNAERFSSESFCAEFKLAVENALSAHNARVSGE